MGWGVGVGIDAVQGGVVREGGHPGEAAEVLAAPADEVALLVVGGQLEAAAQPLDLGPPQVQVVLVAVHHAGDDDLLVVEDVLDGGGEFVHEFALGRAWAFLMGATFSALVGFVGMRMATTGNLRVAAAAPHGFGKALRGANE